MVGGTRPSGTRSHILLGELPIRSKGQPRRVQRKRTAKKPASDKPDIPVRDSDSNSDGDTSALENFDKLSLQDKPRGHANSSKTINRENDFHKGEVLQYELVNSIKQDKVINHERAIEATDDTKSEPDEDELEEAASTVQKAIMAQLSHLGRFKRHYDYHSSTWDHLEYIKNERLDCHWCQIKLFSTHKDYPISITNDADDDALPPHFKFIETSILGKGVEVAEDDFRSGCDCKKDLDCKYVGCHCLQDMEEDDADEHGKIFSYHGDGARKECLRGAKLESRDPIYECHAGCACSGNCGNRVVERGRKIPLNIFKTKDGRGWGVRSKAHIKKGQLIDKYIGEIITSDEANNRRLESDVAQRKDVYLFALDKFSDPNGMDPRLAGPAYEVDGEFCSGPTRFINHSCEPNLRSFARVGDHADKHIHDLAFFAIEDIPADTELTFDYIDGVDGEDTDLKEDSNDPEKLKDMTKCLCGSNSCRGFLW